MALCASCLLANAMTTEPAFWVPAFLLTSDVSHLGFAMSESWLNVSISSAIKSRGSAVDVPKPLQPWVIVRGIPCTANFVPWFVEL